MSELLYKTLSRSVTFEEILLYWVGEQKYKEIKQYTDRSDEEFLDDCITIIRRIELIIMPYLKNGTVHLYNRRNISGRFLYYEIQYDEARMFSETRPGYGEDLNKSFQFMIHYNNIPANKSEELYFDIDELVQNIPIFRDIFNQKLLEGRSERVRLTISTSSWAGRTGEYAFSQLRSAGFCDCVIAYILIEKLNLGKNEAGRLFYPDDAKTGDVRENSTYSRKIQKLLNECNDKYLLNFIE